jgi:hypothetical protein
MGDNYKKFRLNGESSADGDKIDGIGEIIN